MILGDVVYYYLASVRSDTMGYRDMLHQEYAPTRAVVVVWWPEWLPLDPEIRVRFSPTSSWENLEINERTFALQVPNHQITE